MAKQFTYTVRGSWPFPVDMLRHDIARAATDADQAIIDRLSADHAEGREDFRPVDIHLVAESKPNTARWESFGWSVPTDAEHAFFKAAREKAARWPMLLASAHAKLTEDERDAVAWANGRWRTT